MLNRSQTGIAFSDDGVTIVKLAKNIFGKFWLEDYGKYDISDEAIFYGVIKNQGELVNALKSLNKKEKIKSAYISLPNENENISEDYTKDYKEVLREAKIKGKSFEAEGDAIRRALVGRKEDGTYMIVNIEKNHTAIYIIDAKRVVFSSLVEVGLNTFFEITETSLQKENVLSKSLITKQVSSSLLSGLSVLKDATKKCLVRWQTRIGDGDPIRPSISKIILCGSGASIEGIDEYLSVNLKMNVEIGNVWKNVLNPREEIPALPFKESLSFASAIGTALKRFE